MRYENPLYLAEEVAAQGGVDTGLLGDPLCFGQQRAGEAEHRRVDPPGRGAPGAGFGRPAGRDDDREKRFSDAGKAVSRTRGEPKRREGRMTIQSVVGDGDAAEVAARVRELLAPLVARVLPASADPARTG